VAAAQAAHPVRRPSVLERWKINTRVTNPPAWGHGMPHQNEPGNEELEREIRALRGVCRSVLLATVDSEGLPDASSAPCLVDAEGNIYIFVSGLARHTRNLSATGRVSAMFIEDEAEAANIFARRRLILTCTAVTIARDHPEWEAYLDSMTERLGRLVGTLRGLGDFQLFRLTPHSATYVRGFGQTFHFEGEGLKQVSLVRPERRSEK
jgi:putative heme iron utilization protein